MGYTHYWRSRGFTDNQWAQLQECTRQIIRRARRAGAAVAGWEGSGAPEYGADRIAFNGRAPHDYETFALARDADGFAFCKTGRAPYDAAVVAVLIVAARIAPDAFTWSSDGDASEHIAGAKLAADLPTAGAFGGAAETTDPEDLEQ